jgi:hypothetical protein
LNLAAYELPTGSWTRITSIKNTDTMNITYDDQADKPQLPFVGIGIMLYADSK